MVSRDTAIQISAVIVAFVGFLLPMAVFGIRPRSPLGVVLATLWNVSILGGAHLYLAVRGESGLVPVESRWRFVSLLALLAVVWLTWLLARPVISLSSSVLASVLIAVAGLAIVGYWITEAADGYRASRHGRT